MVAPETCWFQGFSKSPLVVLLIVILIPLNIYYPSNNTEELYPSLLDNYTYNYSHISSRRKQLMGFYSFNFSYNSVDRRHSLSPKEFYHIYDGKWPVLITDHILTQTNVFSTAHLVNKYGKERVTMKIVNGTLGSATGDRVSLESFYNQINISQPNNWLYIEDELFISTRTELMSCLNKSVYLKDDFFQLFPFEIKPWNAMLLWGTKFSRSSLHIDPYNWTGTNFVIKGRKKWKLYPPGQDHFLYVKHKQESGFPLNCYKYNSPIDTFDYDSERYPLFNQAKAIEFEQKSGELLIIPTGWFHQAYNAEETLAIAGQVMNINNYRVVLEEILKFGQVKRCDLPHDIDKLSPENQIKQVISALPPEIIRKGKELTDSLLKDLKDKIS